MNVTQGLRRMLQVDPNGIATVDGNPAAHVEQTSAAIASPHGTWRRAAETSASRPVIASPF